MTDGPEATRRFHAKNSAIFEALPPRNSQEYLRHLRTAETADLPAQVLVRAYRECAAEDWEEARDATFNRLARELSPGRFEYLNNALWYLARKLPGSEYASEAVDLLQETLMVMLRVLPTDRGSFGERSWSGFARQCASQAWRERYGRRGEWIEPHHDRGRTTDDGEERDPVDEIPGSSRADEAEIDVHALLREVIGRIPDPFVRAVGEDQWLSGNASDISGKGLSAGGKPSLVQSLGERRDRIVRAAYAVEARIIAELVDRGIEPERLAHFRKKPR